MVHGTTAYHIIIILVPFRSIIQSDTWFFFVIGIPSGRRIPHHIGPTRLVVKTIRHSCSLWDMFWLRVWACVRLNQINPVNNRRRWACTNCCVHVPWYAFKNIIAHCTRTHSCRIWSSFPFFNTVKLYKIFLFCSFRFIFNY